MDVPNVDNQLVKINVYKTFSGSELITKLVWKTLSGSELAKKPICKTSSAKRVDTQEIMKPETDYMTTTRADVLNENSNAKDTVSIGRQHQQRCGAKIGKETSSKLFSTDSEPIYTIYSGVELVQEPTTTSYSPSNDLSDKTCSGIAIYRQLSASIEPVYSSNDEVKKTICRTLSADDAVDLNKSYTTAQMTKPAKLRILGKKKNIKYQLKRAHRWLKKQFDPKTYTMPTRDQAEKWSFSFDSLLHDKCGIKLFMKFLRLEFSEENLEFWIECEAFRHCQEKQRPEFARKIIDGFVVEYAPKQINLDNANRTKITDNTSFMSIDYFTDAQRQIQALMEKDSYQRFIESTLTRFTRT